VSSLAWAGVSAMDPPQGRPWGISHTSIGRLRHSGAPYVLLLIAAYLGSLHNGVSRTLDMAEVFAGQAELSQEFRNAGMKVKDYDIQNNALTNDITTDIGFLHACFLVPACHADQHAPNLSVCISANIV
jgi:hypothetical protein